MRICAHYSLICHFRTGSKQRVLNGQIERKLTASSDGHTPFALKIFFGDFGLCFGSNEDMRKHTN
jgi:hypothetical protein